MSPTNATSSTATFKDKNAASKLSPYERKELAVEALSGKSTITKLAEEANTSRKFIYSQKHKAAEALDEAFLEEKSSEEKVLFYLPVTKDWLKQLVIALILVCHSSYQGVVEIFRDLLNTGISKGGIHNILRDVLEKVKEINSQQDLSRIKAGAHDEIFQGRTPVLVGCDVESTYTYLLKRGESRDTTTWGVHLLELSDQGISLDYTIADGGKGLRSGQREAWPDVPCRGDVFHALYDIGKTVRFLGNRAESALEIALKLETKTAKAKKKNQGAKYSRHLGHARKEAQAAEELKNDISTLSTWLKNDILSVTGPDLAARRNLLDFVINELRSRESQSPHRIKPVRCLLESQGEDLLRFVEELDKILENLADTHDVSLYLTRQVFELQANSTKSCRYWERTEELYGKIGRRFYDLQEAIQDLIEETVRASSIAENLNSRLRNYFFLRKTLNDEYLELLQFFLNHRRFIRSSRPERVGKSPKELLTGESHDHWLVLLGYSLFKREEEIAEPTKKAA